MASERESEPSCLADQASIALRNAGESRIAVTGSTPVEGRPRFFRTTAIASMSNV